MTTFQDRIEALLQELPDTDELEESKLKEAARFKITAEYSRADDPTIPIDYTLENVRDAMEAMFGIGESLSDFDDRASNPLPPYYGELADALIHVDTVWTIMEQLSWDGLLLLFVNHDGKRLTRWRDDLRRLKSPISKHYNEAYAALFDLLEKKVDGSESSTAERPDLDSLLADELSSRINAIEEKIESLRDRSFLKIAREYRDAIEPFL